MLERMVIAVLVVLASLGVVVTLVLLAKPVVDRLYAWRGGKREWPDVDAWLVIEEEFARAAKADEPTPRVALRGPNLIEFLPTAWAVPSKTVMALDLASDADTSPELEAAIEEKSRAFEEMFARAEKNWKKALEARAAYRQRGKMGGIERAVTTPQPSASDAYDEIWAADVINRGRRWMRWAEETEQAWKARQDEEPSGAAQVKVIPEDDAGKRLTERLRTYDEMVERKAQQDAVHWLLWGKAPDEEPSDEG